MIYVFGWVISHEMSPLASCTCCCLLGRAHESGELFGCCPCGLLAVHVGAITVNRSRWDYHSDIRLRLVVFLSSPAAGIPTTPRSWPDVYLPNHISNANARGNGTHASLLMRASGKSSKACQPGSMGVGRYSGLPIQNQAPSG